MSTISQNTVTEPTPVETQGGTPSNSGGFQPGNVALGTYISEMIEALMKYYNDKNEVFTLEARAESNMSIAYSDSQIALGQEQQEEMNFTGAFAIAGGGITGIMGIGGEIADRFDGFNDASDRLNEANELKSGLKQTRSITFTEDGAATTGEDTPEAERYLTENAEKVKERLNEMIEEIKEGRYGKDPAAVKKLTDDDGREISDQSVINVLKTDDEFARLKTAVDERVTAAQNEVSNKLAARKSRMDSLTMWSQAINGITSGSGSIGAGYQKAAQGEQQAYGTQYQTAQQRFQSLARETESQADQILQTAEGLIQLIPELARGNTAVGTQ
ncbi:MAG: hypothetical protein KDK76_02215 [Chlamydiia bacterium]|nr:hypothetical protein [Chlamydiia bacterium]